MKRGEPKRTGWRGMAWDFLWTLGAVILVQVGVVQAYHVPSGSMERTVRVGDRVVVDKLTLGVRTPDWIGLPWTDHGTRIPALKLPGLRRPRAGDLVLVRTVMDDRIPYIKRVVALEGQVVEFRDKVLHVDGRPRPVPGEGGHVDVRLLLSDEQTPGIPPVLGNRDTWGPYQVPAGHLFLLGDNRDNSVDSRFFGPVSEENVIGLARAVGWSWDSSPDCPLLRRLRLERVGRLL